MESLADFTGGGLYSSFPSKGHHRSVKYTKLHSNHDGDDESLYGEIVNICKLIQNIKLKLLGPILFQILWHNSTIVMLRMCIINDIGATVVSSVNQTIFQWKNYVQNLYKWHKKGSALFCPYWNWPLHRDGYDCITTLTWCQRYE